MLIPEFRAEAANRDRSWAEPPVTRTLAGTIRPSQGPDSTVMAAGETCCDISAPLPGAVPGPAPVRPRQIIMVTTRCAASASRSGGSAPLCRAAMMAAWADSTFEGISSRSAPAASASGAAESCGNCFRMAPMLSASVTATPSNPILRNSAYAGLDTDAGTPGSSAGTAMWPTMTIGSPASMAAWKGSRSFARSWA